MLNRAILPTVLTSYKPENNPLFLVLLFMFSLSTYGQQAREINTYYNWFDGMVGIENTGLYRGVEYVEQYRTINDMHKFFESPVFREGFIVYGGEPYFNVPMKYDLYEDQIFVNLDSKYGFSVFKLIQDQISDFSLDGHHFLRINYKDKNGSDVSGFEEVLVSNQFFTFFKKYRKTPLERHKNQRIYYEFRSKDRYSLIYRDVYYAVENQNDIKKIFPEFKKEIIAYSNKPLKKYDFDKYMKSVLDIVAASLSKDAKISVQ